MVPAPDGPPDITAMALGQIRTGISSIEEVRARLDAPSWTVNTTVSLSPVQIRELTQAIQRQLLKQAQRNQQPRRLA